MKRVLIITTRFGPIRAILIGAFVVFGPVACSRDATPHASQSGDAGVAPSGERSNETARHDAVIAAITRQVQADEWDEVGGAQAQGDAAKRVVKTNELIECRAENAEHVLTLDLYRGETQLATQTRYLRRHAGPEKEIGFDAKENLICAMYVNGFLSGESKISGKSERALSIQIDWKFDDPRAKLQTHYQCEFDATLGESGTIDCENGATLCWRLEPKRSSADNSDNTHDDRIEQPSPPPRANATTRARQARRVHHRAGG